MPEAARGAAPSAVRASASQLLGLGPRWPAISGCLWFRHRDEHCEAQAEDERFRVAVHVGEGEKGTEHHVGEAASGDARMQTEAAREMREEEDCWQDAGGHEEETETCGATLRGRTARPRLVHARRRASCPEPQGCVRRKPVRVLRTYAARLCTRCTFQHRQKPIDRGLKPNVCFSVSTTTKACTLNDLQ